MIFSKIPGLHLLAFLFYANLSALCMLAACNTQEIDAALERGQAALNAPESKSLLSAMREILSNPDASKADAVKLLKRLSEEANKRRGASLGEIGDEAKTWALQFVSIAPDGALVQNVLDGDGKAVLQYLSMVHLGPEKTAILKTAMDASPEDVAAVRKLLGMSD